MAAPALAPADRSARASRTQSVPSRREDERTRQRERRQVRVVPGGKAASQVSPRVSSLAKFALFALAVFAIIGILRVGIISASYGVASQTSELRTQISEMESESSSLSIQKSLVASPSNLRNEATSLGMSASSEAETITLSEDVVKLDSKGNLSLSSSLAAVAKKD